MRHVVLIATAVLVMTSSSLHGAEEEGDKMVNLYVYLPYTLLRLDCYVTIERRRYAIDQSHLQTRGEFKRYALDTYAHDVTADPGLDSIEALKDKLQRELEGVVVRRSRRNPKVLHLIDAELLTDDSYPFEQKVDVKYEGNLPGLIESIGLESFRFGNPRYGWRSHWNDGATRVKVQAKDMAVRDVLVESLDLEGYRRFVWTATTFEVGGPPSTVIQFAGPRDENDERHDAIEEEKARLKTEEQEEQESQPR